MSFFSKILSFFMTVLLFLSGAVRGSTPEKAEKLRVVTYLVINDLAGAERVDDSHFGDVTDVILFGDIAGVNGDGEVVLNDDFDRIISHMKQIGGGYDLKWHLNFALITEKDKKTELREAFRGKKLARNIRDVLEKYGLDGAFFDYEFPMEWDAKLDFSIFLINLDKALGDDFLIGAALQPWCARFLPGAISAIDMVELMCYDNWDGNGFHSTMELAKQDVRDMVRLGYRLRQIDLGLPFYARPTTKEARWYDYRDYCGRLDENGLAPADADGLIPSFNTPQLIYDKTAWAIETGLGGVMVWHYACDVPEPGAASLFSAITRAKTGLANQE